MKKMAFIIFLIVFTVAISLGAVDIPFLTVWKIAANNISGSEIFHPQWSRGMGVIVWKIRFPRAILSFLTGGTLALVGVLMQAVTKNPLSDPYILGISSGASTGAVLCMFFGLGGLSVGGGAFIGAFLATIMVIGLTKGDYSSSRLVLTGIAVSALFSSITSIMIYLVKDESKVRNAVFWMAGSLGGAQWGLLLLPAAVLLLGGGAGILLHKELDTLLLGEEEARVLGIDTTRLKLLLIGVSSILTGTIVAITGTIGFVGMIIPHISRRLTGSGHRQLIPLVVLIGGTFMAGADTLARIVFTPEELPIGILTSALGGPFFLWIIRRGYAFGGQRA
ncbi:iron chelate uptake ABC transporter FeCT family, permease [Propionigenium maris DSM 9537]|uniref:Iron chelate uptake ABC transporter FeCT family, permease n=2 Tax=Propionigenium TaxID=2332 RepID=A0A9W6GNL8_9FUSO|nr:iron chelate uptake ABC transporter FeCT family, permease [Propionigenium maris DSM 9537]